MGNNHGPGPAAHQEFRVPALRVSRHVGPPAPHRCIGLHERRAPSPLVATDGWKTRGFRWRNVRRVRRPKVLSVPAGMIRGADYTQAIVRPAVGDVLVLYTGGLTEAVNGLGEDLGLPALFEAARKAPIDSPVALGKAVLQ